MNYYKGLEMIGKTGDFDKIPTTLIKSYIADFTLELYTRNQVKLFSMPDVIKSVCTACGGEGWIYSLNGNVRKCKKC